MKKTILIFGGLATAIMVLFELSKFSIISKSMNENVFLVISGVLFVGVGYLLSRFFLRKTETSKEVKIIDEEAFNKVGLSKREYEILELIAEGKSNYEIGEQLFISESTVKTHVSNTLMKLNARRRTQAVQIGRDLNIIS